MNKRLNFSVYRGKDCTYEHGCFIKPLGSNSTWQKFETVQKYLLLEGNAEMTYMGNNTPYTISSPYGSDWTNYVDTWVYDDQFTLKVNPSTVFTNIKLLDESNNVLPSTIKTAKVENTTLTFNTNANSILLVIGNDFVYNGNTANNPPEVHTYNIEQTGEISIVATSKCICILVE